MDAKKQAKQEKKRKREELTLFGLEMENIKQAETKQKMLEGWKRRTR